MNAAPAADNEMLRHFADGVRAFQKTQFSLEPREELEGQYCNVTVVFRGSDVIFQLFPKRKWPKTTNEGRALLSELVDVYFGDTSRFSASWVPELSSWALKASGLSETLSYDKDHHVYGFAAYINQALADL